MQTPRQESVRAAIRNGADQDFKAPDAWMAYVISAWNLHSFVNFKIIPKEHMHKVKRVH